MRRPRLIAFLGDGRSYGLAAAEVETIITHAAVMFLVGERAFKMKRAVRYSFFDFTRLERVRRRSRQNSPEPPHGFHALSPPDPRDRRGARATGPGRAGEPLEWLLEMRRFGQDARLDRVAERGSMEPG